MIKDEHTLPLDDEDDSQLDLPTTKLVKVDVIPIEEAPLDVSLDHTLDALPAELLQKPLPFADRARPAQAQLATFQRAPRRALPAEDIDPMEAKREPSAPTPPDLDVATVARVGADITALGATAALARHGLTRDAWAAIELRLTERMAIEAERDEWSLRDAFDDAYLEARERHRGAFDVEAFAELRVELQSGRVDGAITEMTDDVVDAMRFMRALERRIAADPTLAARLAEATERARAKLTLRLVSPT